MIWLVFNVIKTKSLIFLDYLQASMLNQQPACLVTFMPFYLATMSLNICSCPRRRWAGLTNFAWEQSVQALVLAQYPLIALSLLVWISAIPTTCLWLSSHYHIFVHFSFFLMAISKCAESATRSCLVPFHACCCLSFWRSRVFCCRQNKPLPWHLDCPSCVSNYLCSCSDPGSINMDPRTEKYWEFLRPGQAWFWVKKSGHANTWGLKINLQ